MARKLLADPALAQKLIEGRPEDIRPCIYCYTCVAQPFFDRPVRCAVNPMTGHEDTIGGAERETAATPRRVLIVGGGPSGLEAARLARLVVCTVVKGTGDDRVTVCTVEVDPAYDTVAALKAAIRAAGGDEVDASRGMRLTTSSKWIRNDGDLVSAYNVGVEEDKMGRPVKDLEGELVRINVCTVTYHPETGDEIQYNVYSQSTAT